MLLLLLLQRARCTRVLLGAAASAAAQYQRNITK
jgi:hypothetical protein